MKLEINSMFSVLMLLLTGSSQTGVISPGQIRTSPSPDLTKDPRDELLQRTHNPAGWDKMSADPPTTTPTRPTVRSETSTEAGPNVYFYPSSSTASQHTHSSSSSSAPRSDSEGRPSSSHPTLQDVGSKDPTSTKHQESEPSTASTWNTGLTPTLASGRAPAGPTNQEGPPKLNVEDKALKASHRRSSSPLDPLLAGLLSVFIVTTAIVFVVLFFKFRQRTNHPEFHRLQDLPMDDLMEDTPLSRYTH